MGSAETINPEGVRNRDFSNFLLGDNVYELADGLVPEVAQRLGVDIGDSPTSEGLGRLIGAVGKNKVLRDNREVTGIELDELADFVERAGTQVALNRSLWTPERKLASPRTYGSSHIMPDATIISGAVANWVDRSLTEVVKSIDPSAPVYAPAGNRVMDTATERTNPNVADMRGRFGRYPTEAMYLGTVGLWHMMEAGEGHDLLTVPYTLKDGAEIAQQFFRDHPYLAENDRKLAVVRNANAGILLATQLRVAAREINSEFDGDPRNPQLFVKTDAFPVARTEEERGTPRQYQAPQPGLRQVIVTAKVLHEAARGE